MGSGAKCFGGDYEMCNGIIRISCSNMCLFDLVHICLPGSYDNSAVCTLVCFYFSAFNCRAGTNMFLGYGVVGRLGSLV